MPPRSSSRLGPCSRSRLASFLVGEPATHFVGNAGGAQHDRQSATWRLVSRGSGGWRQDVVDGGIFAINSLRDTRKSWL